MSCGAGSIQEQWLRADLAAHPAACTLAFWHHPRYSSGHDGSHVTLSAFWSDLHAAGAELVLSGHSHDYERFAPKDAQGKNVRGRHPAVRRRHGRRVHDRPWDLPGLG